MNPETQQALNQFLQQALAGLQQAGQFTLEQAPLVVQEYLAWMFWSSVLWAGCGVAMLLTALVLGLWVRSAVKRVGWSRDGWPEIPGVIGAVVLTVAGLSMVMPNIEQAIKIKVAPRVVVMEKLQKMVK